MSLLVDGRLSVIDKDVTQALANLELTAPIYEIPDNQNYRDTVSAFIATALRKSEIKELSDRAGLTVVDLVYLYSVGITCLVPNPLIMVGNTLLASTLLFMEPIRFREVVENIERNLESSHSPEDRFAVIATVTEQAVRAIKKAHDSARGVATMPSPGRPVRRQSTGCLVALFSLPLAALSAVVAGSNWS